MIDYPDYHRATNMAYSILQRLAITTLPVTIFPAITRFPHIRVVSYSEFCYRKGLSHSDFMGLNVSERGFICREGKNAIIFYNDSVDAGIVRFTLAHELGHYSLGHTSETPTTDKEANCFARNFLCPIPVTDHFALDDVNDCCDIYDISPPAAEVALDKRIADRRNIEATLYSDTFHLFGLACLTKESQLKRYSARAMRAFSDFSEPYIHVPLAI